MSSWRVVIAWGLAGLAGLAVAVWVFPRVILFSPREWKLTRQEALEVALAGFDELGEPVADPYVVPGLIQDGGLEKLLNQTPEADAATRRSSYLADWILRWRVVVYRPGRRIYQRTYLADVALSGEILALRLEEPPEEAGPPPDPETARRRADQLLIRQGLDLSPYEEPSVLRTDRAARTDTEVRYRDRQALLGEESPYGVAVTFAGDRLTGSREWREVKDPSGVVRFHSTTNFLGATWSMLPLLPLLCTAFFFLRRYHAGEIGVRRAIQVFVVVFLAGVAGLVPALRALSEDSYFFVIRQLATWATGLQFTIFVLAPTALSAALSWAVGEARCRERWPQKLAGFDALLQGRWTNATVARAALRGMAVATVLAAALLLLLGALRPLGVWSGITLVFNNYSFLSSWPGLSLIFFAVASSLYAELFAVLFLLPAAVRRLGIWGGGLAAAAVDAVIFIPPFLVDPPWWFLLFALLRSAMLVALFVRYDLLTMLIAASGSRMVIGALPLLLAQHPSLRLQGVLPLIALALPLVLGIRHLRRGRELVYRYDDVPVHVRRIAERERLRLELETARRIQSSILPALPPQLAGIELAYCYLPATEVGGDFYDAQALDDGRLAVAVGDVAGHGVSSGLIMAMAKATLAVQMTVDPEVAAIFRTMNRMVFRSARMRRVTTLCYLLVDPRRRELSYASAGHVGPYRIGAGGRVEGLPAASYPLGVREEVEVAVRSLRLTAGDRLFVFSDGVVEARRPDTDELYGFARLEQCLERHAGRDPSGLRNGVLADLRRFTGTAQREDDQTMVVLKIP